MNKDFTFSIGHFLETPIGTREVYSFEFPINFEDINTASNVTGKVEMMKLEDCFNVRLLDIKVDIIVRCGRDLKDFTYKIEFDAAERQFLMESPKDVPDPFDLYLVDKKSLTLDVSEMLRQEIILHFPPNPVCCDGESELSKFYSVEQKPENKPLSALQDLIKQ